MKTISNLKVDQLVHAKRFMAPKKPDRQQTISSTRRINILVIEKMLQYCTIPRTYLELWRNARGVIHHKASWIRYLNLCVEKGWLFRHEQYESKAKIRPSFVYFKTTRKGRDFLGAWQTDNNNV